MFKNTFNLIGAILLALITSSAIANPPSLANSPSPFPQQDLGKRVQGDQAITALGSKLDDVAAWYKMTPKDFAKLLRRDNTAWLDEKGRLFYIDNTPKHGIKGNSSTTASTEQASAAPFPLSETFMLHSKPGAKRVIFLDFDGHITSGTAWNSRVDPIVSPTYSSDADHSTFSNQELEDIQNMWRQVAEDYAPFDVDVTTEDPGQNAITRSSLSDEYYGTRVVVTDDNFDNCRCGGFAYVGVFNDIGDYYKPAFVFNTSLVGAGEAITHEAGHNLGLWHDGPGYYEGHGSGPTGWAPIMGVGYYQQLVQWSKGEYAGADEFQDDIAVIQTYGLPLKADDHGNAPLNATAMTAQEVAPNTLLSTSGVITTRTDVDMFSFMAGAGSYTFDVLPAPFSPNLDIKVQLFDSNNQLMATVNPVDLLTASFSGNFAVAGEYFLSIQGTGKGDPLDTGYTDYASLGQYSISGSVAQVSNLSPPQAMVNVTYTPGFAPLMANFDAIGSSDDGTIVSYHWDFGDGNSANTATTSNEYMAPGDYQAVLTVTDNDGLTDTDSVLVSVDNQLPTVSIASSALEGPAPYNASFTSNATDPDPSGSISSYLWDFGDGGSSTLANPSHEYTQEGPYKVTLEVTDNLGGVGTSNELTVTVTPPDFVISHVTYQILGAGTVTGSFDLLADDDDSTQQIRERESGGRPASRYSYLEHTWVIDSVRSGSLVTLYLDAWMTDSSDNDAMAFSYTSTNYSGNLITVSNTQSNGLMAIALPNDISGRVEIKVTDTDKTQGNRDLDTVFVDTLYIRTDNVTNISKPLAPSLLTATPQSSSNITLNWSDNADNEDNYIVERRLTGQQSWQQVANLAANSTSYPDTGLSANTSYDYQVAARNLGGSTYSNIAAATTEQASDLSLSASGYKVKGLQKVDLSWTNLNSVLIYRDGSLLNGGQTVSGFEYTDNINNKGGGSYSYQVCSEDLSVCSDIVNVTF